MVGWILAGLLGLAGLERMPPEWSRAAGDWWPGAVIGSAILVAVGFKPFVRWKDEREWERMRKEKFRAEIDAVRFQHSTHVVKLGEGEAALSPLPLAVRPESAVSHLTLTPGEGSEERPEREDSVWRRDQFGRLMYGIQPGQVGATAEQVKEIMDLRDRNPKMSHNKIAEAVFGHHGGHQNDKVKQVLQEGRYKRAERWEPRGKR
jgi:hypothetical protein